MKLWLQILLQHNEFFAGEFFTSIEKFDVLYGVKCFFLVEGGLSCHLEKSGFMLTWCYPVIIIKVHFNFCSVLFLYGFDYIKDIVKMFLFLVCCFTRGQSLGVAGVYIFTETAY